MKKLLVTGGAGFIGSNFIRYILNKYPDYAVVNLDKLTYCGNPANLKDVANDSRYQFIQGDICDRKAVAEAVRGCGIIVNFAAQTHVDKSILNASEFIQTNVLGTYVLLEAAREHRVSLFCHISTDEVYGSREEGFFKETDALKPSSPYSASKAGADELVRSYFVTYKLPVVIVRPTNNFGRNQYPEKVIPLFITNILQGKKVGVYGKGENIRDWLYVADTCRAIDLLIHQGKAGEIYNVAGKNEWKNIDLTRLILQMMKKSEDLIEFVEDRAGHDRRYALDCRKINKLGWRAQDDFLQALNETIAWYRDNRQWWEPLVGGRT